MSPFQRSERDPLWRREMRERWRRPITLLFLAVYAAGLSWVAYSLYSSIVPPGGVQLGPQARGIGHRLFMSLLRIQILVWIPLALLLAAPTVAAERERHALTEYLLAGLEAGQIVRAKFASIATFVVVMCAIPLPVLALCFPLGGVEPLELVAGFVLEIAVAIACASVGLLISVNNRRVTAAMQNAVFLALIFLFLGTVISPSLLQTPFGTWLVLACVLAVGTKGILMGCEYVLGLVARHLEQDEHGAESLRAPIVAPTPAPIGSYFQESPQAAQRTLSEELLRSSSWDAWIEKASACSAVAQREVRVGLRASRLRMAIEPDKPTYQFSPWVWAVFGACGAAMIAFSHIPEWWRTGLTLTTLATLVAATSGASAAFTREREQKMLAQLQVCPLSPLEVVGGKIGAVLLLVTRSWGGPLLGLFVAGLSQGAVVAAGTVLMVVLSLLLAVTLATMLSLVCHRTAVATSGTLAILFVLFVLLPFASPTLLAFVPSLRTALGSFPLSPFWIEPMQVVMNTSNGFTAATLSLPESLLRVICSLVVLSALFLLGAIALWARTSPDDGAAKTRFWERDISRSWR